MTVLANPAAPPKTITTFGEEWAGGGWPIVLSAFVGMVFGLSGLPFYSLGPLAKPIAADMHWSRGVVQTGLVFSMFGQLTAAWGVGWCIDRFGVRRVALASQLGLALGLLLLASQGGNPAFWCASWFIMAVMGMGTTPLTWSRGVAGWFVAGRGRALGIVLAGTGVTAFLAPPIITALAAAHGWRAAYIAQAITVLVIALPTVWLLFKQRPPASGAPVVHTTAHEPGLTAKQAIGGYRFWLIMLAFVAVSFGVGGSIPNLIPMLTDQGVTPAGAARYASLLGLGVIAGRLVAGWLLDRFWAPAVALAMLALPAIACLMLAAHVLLTPAVMLIGLAGGAEFDFIAYLCTRYFGMRNYGQIYGWQWASFALAAGAGAAMFGAVFDHTGSYRLILYASAALLVAGPLLLLLLGRYPTFADAE